MWQVNAGSANKNNFNLIRIYLSVSVVLFHCYELSKHPDLAWFNFYFNGETAVQAFFIISGYLILHSYYRSKSLKEYLLKRLRRIYPAYAVIILICALLGCIVSTLSINDYFTSTGLYKYILSNLLFLNFIEPALPGVFNKNIFTNINGSLWTLKIEVGYYLIVPVIVLLRKKINPHVLYASLFIFSAAYFLYFKHLATTQNNTTWLFLSRQLPGQLFYFIAGAWVYELEKKRWFIIFLKWCGLPALLILFYPVHTAVQALFLSIGIFFIAFIIPVIKNPLGKNDFSYGLYIVHYPVIQVFVQYNFFSTSALVTVMATLAVTVILSVCCWYLVEKPFIEKGKLKQFLKPAT